MNTEKTVNNETVGWIFYDADCSLCARSAAWFNQMLDRSGFRLLPVQTPGAAERVGVTSEALLARMHLLKRDGRRFAGADAFVEIARHVKWARLIVAASKLPGVLPVLRHWYDWIAAHRYCLGGTCRHPRRRPAMDWLPLIALTFIALLLVAFGALTFVFANNIAVGEPAARGLCLLMLGFWLVRLFVAVFIFDVRPYLSNWFLRVGYQATNIVFIFLVVVYALAAWKGGRL